MPEKEVKIEISRHEVETDPEVTLFQVVIIADGTWHETYTEGELNIFLKGVEAGLRSAGIMVNIPEVPQKVTSNFIEDDNIDSE